MKKSLLILILVLLTCGCILIPRAISSFRQEKLLSETQFRRRNMEEREALTPITVARLYRDREIGVGTGNQDTIGNGTEYDEMREKGKEILEQVLGTEHPLTTTMKAMLDSSGAGMTRNSALVMIGDRATAVEVVSISVKSESGVLEMVFEEKTKLLLDMKFYSADEDPESVLFTQEMEKEVRTYYENVCGLEEELYTFRWMTSENTSATAGFELGVKRKLTDEEEKNADSKEESEKTS